MKQRINNIYLILIVAVMAVVPVVARAQADSTSSYLLMPLVFDKQQSAAAVSQELGKQQPGLKVDDTWIDRAQQRWGRTHDTRYRLMINKPELVPFNENVLPKPPKEVVVETSPADAELQVEPRNLATEQFKPIDRREVKVHNWLHSFVGSLQGTQAYISNNWYQGGENNLNLLADVQWDCNLNQKLHPNWLFNNTLHYKLGVATAKGDTLRNYSINEDNFQFSSQVGYKAVKNWYYSATLFFKTQLLNSYVTNSKTLAASLLSSGELNLGLGMTYNYKDQEGYKTLTLSIAPLSYNMKICRDIEKIGYNRSFTIFDDDDQQRVLKEILKQLNIDERFLPVREIKAKISDAKNKMMAPDEWFQKTSRDRRNSMIHDVMTEYEKRMKGLNALDFDDLLLKTLILLADHPPVLEVYRRRFRYVLVDEYQDTNRTQYELLRLLTAESRNLCVVGDDDQSIYGWRGADIRNILEFENDYPDAVVIKLEQNYRSTGNILDAANQVIANNEGRKDKTLWTEHGPGEKITVYCAQDERDEAAWIIRQIQELKKNGENLGSIALL